MELVKAHNILLAVPSRWPPIMLGVIISLILSAIFTFNFSSRVTPVPESITSPKLASSQESASPSEHTSFSSQLIILLIRNFYSKQSFSSKRDPNLSRSLNLSSQSSIQSTRSFSQITSSPNYAGGTIWHPGDGRKVGSNVLRDIGSSPSQDTYPVEKTVGGKALTDSNTSTVTASQSDSTSHSIDESSIADQAVASKPRSGGAISNLTWNTTNDHLIDRSIKGMKPDLKRPVNSIQHMVEQFPTALSSTRTEMNSDYCDISKGKWVEDDSGPLYPPGTCPFVDESFNCYGNGRPDSRYSRWRWAPMDCNIPRFNGTFFLERLRGKRLVFVGDSLNRNQWESMLCMLREWLPDKKRIQQINGGRISKLPGAYVFKFLASLHVVFHSPSIA
ncbi:hypothetical protein KP509_36G031800 [Ceratopteris richardii]|uniref:Trichome birefringence-like N-terminal domain-containing protein n=1 Tax=Ceratopteris richardii TaxID=49495 RepID=A0A8T2QBS7_CERRI|nr:hypothetical protein KP509_36G031800 [Ceratopteris richardii]